MKKILSVFTVLATLFACTSNQTTEVHQEVDSKRVEEPDGTVTTEEHTKTDITTTKTSAPVGGSLTANLGGLKGSVGVEIQHTDGTVTKKDLKDGETVPLGKDVESIAIKSTSPKKCPHCGKKINRQAATGKAHLLSPDEIRVTYSNWNLFSDVIASVTVSGDEASFQNGVFVPMALPRDVARAASAVTQYFQGGWSISAPLPSFSNVEVHVDEVLFVEPLTDGSAIFHYYDTEPFEEVSIDLNHQSFDLSTPGAVNEPLPVNGWYHAAIPVPPSVLLPTSNYSSTIKKVGDAWLGGRVQQILNIQ